MVGYLPVALIVASLELRFLLLFLHHGLLLNRSHELAFEPACGNELYPALVRRRDLS